MAATAVRPDDISIYSLPQLLEQDRDAAAAIVQLMVEKGEGDLLQNLPASDREQLLRAAGISSMAESPIASDFSPGGTPVKPGPDAMRMALEGNLPSAVDRVSVAEAALEGDIFETPERPLTALTGPSTATPANMERLAHLSRNLQERFEEIEVPHGTETSPGVYRIVIQPDEQAPDWDQFVRGAKNMPYTTEDFERSRARVEDADRRAFAAAPPPESNQQAILQLSQLAAANPARYAPYSAAIAASGTASAKMTPQLQQQILLAYPYAKTMLQSGPGLAGRLHRTSHSVYTYLVSRGISADDIVQMVGDRGLESVESAVPAAGRSSFSKPASAPRQRSKKKMAVTKAMVTTHKRAHKPPSRLALAARLGSGSKKRKSSSKSPGKKKQKKARSMSKSPKKKKKSTKKVKFAEKEEKKVKIKRKPTEWNLFLARYSKGVKSKAEAMASMKKAAKAWQAKKKATGAGKKKNKMITEKKGRKQAIKGRKGK